MFMELKEETQELQWFCRHHQGILQIDIEKPFWNPKQGTKTALNTFSKTWVINIPLTRVFVIVKLKIYKLATF